jgi:hypothetical protein
MNNGNDQFEDEGNVYRDMDQDRERRRYENDEQDKPKKGWGCVVWTLIILCSTCLLCCCGAGLLFYSLTPKIVDQPADIEQMKSELVEIDLPAGLEPKIGGHWSPMSLGRVTGVGYADEKEGKFLGLVKLSGFNSDLRKFVDNVKKEIISKNSPGQQNDDTTVISSETKQIVMNSGETLEFQFMVMENNKDKKKFYQVLGTIPSASGEIAVIYIVKEEEWDEAATIELLKSIKAKE